MSLLAKYEELATNMTDGSLLYAIRDITETLGIWRKDKDLNDPYIQKLYAEFDAYTVEIQSRRKAA